jgi:hypothetical protein
VHFIGPGNTNYKKMMYCIGLPIQYQYAISVPKTNTIHANTQYVYRIGFTVAGMLLLMHKSEEARLEERQEVEAWFNQKEEALLEALREDR